MLWLSLLFLVGILIALVIISRQLKETNRALSRLSNRIHRWFENSTPVVDEEQLRELKSVSGELNLARNCLQNILRKLEELELESK